jgi:hypothetical protein
MTRDERHEIKAQMRREFAAARAANRAEFIATATPFEMKLDAFMAKAEAAIEKWLAPLIGAAAPAAEDAMSS